MTHHDIVVTDEDIELAHIHWYSPAPDDSCWIVQKEKGTDIAHTLMFNRAEAKQLRDYLDEYLNNCPVK